MTLRELLVGRSVGRSLIRGLAIGALLMVTSHFVFVPVRAHGISMMPTYEEGQFLFFNRLAYRYAPVRRGDIVAITLLSEAVLVKRVIALPGESVRIEDGEVFVNGEALAEPYVQYHIPWNLDEVEVAADEVFVIGDNRSMPAELHDFGRANQSRILGRSMF